MRYDGEFKFFRFWRNPIRVVLKVAEFEFVSEILQLRQFLDALHPILLKKLRYFLIALHLIPEWNHLRISHKSSLQIFSSHNFLKNFPEFLKIFSPKFLSFYLKFSCDSFATCKISVKFNFFKEVFKIFSIFLQSLSHNNWDLASEIRYTQSSGWKPKPCESSFRSESIERSQNLICWNTTQIQLFEGSMLIGSL